MPHLKDANPSERLVEVPEMFMLAGWELRVDPVMTYSQPESPLLEVPLVAARVAVNPPIAPAVNVWLLA
jgi:hypothetical protein